MNPTALAGILATLIILAHQPNGNVLIIADSKVSDSTRMGGIGTRSDYCKIGVAHGVVFTAAGIVLDGVEERRGGRLIRRMGWDANEIASRVVAEHGSNVWTQADLDKVATGWAGEIIKAEKEVERLRGTRKLDTVTGIFVASSKGSDVVKSAISVDMAPQGLTSRWHHWSRSPFDYFGSEDARDAARGESQKVFGPPSFGELEAMEGAGQVSKEVAPPFDEIEIGSNASPKWVKVKNGCGSLPPP